MRTTLATLALTLAVGSTAFAAKPAHTVGNHICGEYVEARTASVFAGPCHYNAELTTTGRDAEMVWHIGQGTWNGTSLDGLTAVAAVSADQNLQDEHATRKSVLYIDSRATDAQAQALVDALKTTSGKSLGDVVAVKRVPISFTKAAETFRVRAEGITTLAVDAMPNRECCKMPNLVWYKPLFQLENRRVGYTRQSGIADKTLGKVWEKNGQNTAFYGNFSV